MALDQLSLFQPPSRDPEGLDYRPGFLSSAEEEALAAHVGALPLEPFKFQGFLGNRRTISFGWHYDFAGSGLTRAEAMPDFLLDVRARAAAFAGLEADALQHALLIEYASGAGIGWHRDRPQFGDVLGISLLAPARLRFRRRQGEGWERTAVIAEPRSIYLLRGPARTEWEHSIPTMETLRYSITFRTLAGSAQAR